MSIRSIAQQTYWDLGCDIGDPSYIEAAIRAAGEPLVAALRAAAERLRELDYESHCERGSGAFKDDDEARQLALAALAAWEAP